jgi:flagellar hook-basal body complex protein FliE
MTDPLRIGAPLTGPLTGPLERPELPAPSSAAGGSFGDLFRKAINDTSGLQDNSKDMIAAYLRGEPIELHQVMAASEEASISLELLVELRNKLTEAYRTVMNIQ